jgi:hypothetical protein
MNRLTRFVPSVVVLAALATVATIVGCVSNSRSDQDDSASLEGMWVSVGSRDTIWLEVQGEAIRERSLAMSRPPKWSRWIEFAIVSDTLLIWDRDSAVLHIVDDSTITMTPVRNDGQFPDPPLAFLKDRFVRHVR